MIFRARNLTVDYDRRTVLEEVSVCFDAGAIVAIIGPNGAGKSTFLKAALGLVPRVTGRVEAFGAEYRPGDPRVAYVPQRESVDWDFPVSVRDVVLMGTYGRVGWCRRPGRAERDAAERAMQAMGIAELAGRQISRLSGGQQQRVFLARALAQDAQITFLDEPLAGVDAATEGAIVEVWRNLRREGKTIVAVHHDLGSVRDIFDEVVILNRRLIAAGPTSQEFTDEALTQAYGHRLLGPAS